MGYVTPNTENITKKILIIVQSVHNIDSHKYKCPNKYIIPTEYY